MHMFLLYTWTSTSSITSFDSLDLCVQTNNYVVTGYFVEEKQFHNRLQVRKQLELLSKYRKILIEQIYMWNFVKLAHNMSHTFSGSFECDSFFVSGIWIW